MRFRHQNTTEKSPLVSVMLSCYNCERYVRLAVRSILDQTYSNLEILITDDCSTDNSYTILTEIARQDSRIVLIKNETNMKLTKSLNNMTAMANGKYIARMDADDIALPKRIEKQVEWMEAHPDCALCGTNAWKIDSKGCIMGKFILPATNEEISLAKYYACPFLHPSVMIKRNVIAEYKYNEEFPVGQDYELWLRILDKHKGYNLGKKLLLYRIFPDTTGKKQRERTVRIIASYLTNNDTVLAEKYVSYIFYGYKITGDGDLTNLLSTMFNQIHDSNGYNFYILLKYFNYFRYNGKIWYFFSHLSVKENCRFVFKIICRMIPHIYFALKRLYICRGEF